MNLERLKDLDFNKEVFILEDLDFNVRASRAGHVLCRCYRYQQMKVNGMRKGGCADGVEESGGRGGGGDEPPAPEEASAPATDVPGCLRFVVQLGAAGLLDASTEIAMVRAITSKDAQMLPAVLAYAQHSTQTPGSMARAAEVLSALLKQA
jgi:hypothetical protein